MQEQTADTFTIPEFKVEVISVPQEVPISIGSVSVQKVSATQVAMTWGSTNGASYDVLSTASLNPASWVTNATVVATGSSTSYTNAISDANTFYRIRAVSPQLLP